MTTPYCSKDQWAKRMNRTDWDTFAAAEDWPSADVLQEALEDATNIMNDEVHINTGGSNVTTSQYLERLEKICFDMTNRMLDIEQARGKQGGDFGFQQWSQADYLMSYERSYLIQISLRLGTRGVGAVGWHK